MASPTTNAKPPRQRDLAGLRSAEPGSAFRGTPKSHGSRGGGRSNGGAGGGGRGARLAGGGAPSRGSKAPSGNGESQPAPPTAPAPSKNKESSPARSQQARTPSQKSAALPHGTSNSNEKSTRPKVPSRRGSRPVPSLVVNGVAPDEAEATPLTPSRPNNRRRRSSQQSSTGKGPTSNAKGAAPTPTPLQKLPGPPTLAVPTITPAVPVSSKEAPPHLAPAHDNGTRHAVDLLVEGTRARAMENRPHTPGSHIDWAGDDDDDSLPDLDDWGVKTESTQASANINEISPILVDSLKTLPELQTSGLNQKATDVDTEPARLPSPSPLTARPGRREPAFTFKAKTPASDAPTIRARPLQPHPSLPAKPVAAAAAAETQKNSRNPAPNGRAYLSPKPPGTVSQRSPSTSHAVLSPGALEPKVDPASVPSPLTSPLPPRPESGLAESIHAPKSAEISVKSPLAKSAENEKYDTDEGIRASIHAPKDVTPDSRSALTLSPQSAPPGPRSFSPPHGHSATEGHIPRNPGAFSNHRSTRSGATSPLGKSGLGHARTHSSPAGPGHRTRPVISGDALSRIKRTIGGTPRSAISAKD